MNVDEQVLQDLLAQYQACIMNDGTPSHFHVQIASFSSIDLAIVFLEMLMDYTRQTRKISPALARFRVHWPNIVPYMGIHWANFPGLSGTCDVANSPRGRDHLAFNPILLLLFTRGFVGRLAL